MTWRCMCESLFVNDFMVSIVLITTITVECYYIVHILKQMIGKILMITLQYLLMPLRCARKVTTKYTFRNVLSLHNLTTHYSDLLINRVFIHRQMDAQLELLQLYIIFYRHESSSVQ